MARYMVERNYVQVVGKIWMPAVTCAMEYPLTRHDIENIGEFTRENVEQWLCIYARDFQSIEDFHASVGDQDIPWATEDGECAYADCMFQEY